MKILKSILAVLTTLVVVSAITFGFACLCKACGWLPSFTDWLDTNIFTKLGIEFFAKLGQ